jgi:cytochrome c oxidase subunit 2
MKTLGKFMLKYRYRKGVHEEGEHIEGNTALEVVWTVIPIIIVLFLATYSFANFVKQRNAPEGAMELKVVGFMWGWEFEYPNGKKVYAFFNPRCHKIQHSHDIHLWWHTYVLDRWANGHSQRNGLHRPWHI